MSHDIYTIIGDYESFLSRAFADLGKAGFNIATEFKELDHIAYRVETLERYEELKTRLQQFGKIISENVVDGWPIIILQFTRPLSYETWNIRHLELPAPKEGSPYPEGLEHIEFVLNGNHQEFIAFHPDQQFDTTGLARRINPEISLAFDGYSVKFHLRLIDEVVRIQKETGEL